MHNNKITLVVGYEEEINSQHMEKYSVVMHYLARIEKSGDKKYIVWTADTTHISKPADFPDFISGFEVLWRHVSAYLYLPEEVEDNTEEDFYALDVETRQKLFLIMQNSLCKNLFSFPNVMFIAPSCHGSNVAIQVGVLGKGMVPISVVTNEPCYIPKEITVKDIGTFKVVVCEGWTDQFQFNIQCGQDIASKKKMLSFGTIGGALQLKDGTSMERFVTTCEHVINSQDTIKSHSPSSSKLKLLVYLGYHHQVQIDNANQDPPDYKKLLSFAMDQCSHVEFRDAMYKVREDLRITPTPDGNITWKEVDAFTTSIDIGEYVPSDQLPNQATVVVQGISCEVSSDVSVIRLNTNKTVVTNSCNTFNVCVDSTLNGTYAPKRFMSLRDIFEIFNTEKISVSMSGVTRVNEKYSRSGTVSAPIHLRQLHSLSLKNYTEVLLYNQVLVSSSSAFGFKGDSGAWVLAHYRGECNVLGVFVGKVYKASNSGFFYYVSTASHLEKKYKIF
mmetsp:Transcript_12052/g.16551  ORF Transcript_12052/g.16551 Transcript_12052/m.16551 type:complete len:502 (-) Transcript_12052:19-1524(-)